MFMTETLNKLIPSSKSYTELNAKLLKEEKKKKEMQNVSIVYFTLEVVRKS